MCLHSTSSSGGRGNSSAGGTDDGGGLALDTGAWPIVHGSPESMDYTVLPTPTTAALRFYNTQELSPSTSGDDGGDEFEDGGALLAAMQRAVARAGGGLLEGLLPFAAAVAADGKKSFSMADANPVSIISERVSDQEQRL